MKKYYSFHWILGILFFLYNSAVFNAQVLDATFSSPTTTQCGSGTFTLNANSSGYQSYNWTVTGPNSFLSNLSGENTSLVLTEVGSYNVSLTVSDGTISETSSINGFLSVQMVPIINAISDQHVCHNQTTQPIYFSGGNLNTLYQWTHSNQAIGFYPSTGVGDIPPFQAVNLSTSVITSTVMVTPVLNTCTGAPIYFDINVHPLPTVNAGNDITLCAGQSYTPIASGSSTANFSWSNNVSNGVPFIPESSVVLSLTAQLNGCTASDDVLLTVIPLPIVSITSFDGEDSLACDGSLSFTVVNGAPPFFSYTYLWTNGSGSFTTPIIENLCSGIYSLTVVDQHGCSSTDSAVINDTLIPVIVGDTLIFTDNIYQDSTIIGSDTSDWIENCTFDFDLATGATIDSYVDSGDSTFVTWIISLSDGTTIPVVASYHLSPGTAGVYELTLQLVCSQKSGPKFISATSRIYYEGSTVGIQSKLTGVIHLYPNPANSSISISGPNEEFKYEIRDLQGKLVKYGRSDKNILIESLPAGSYLISIHSEKGNKQLRFVKM